LGIATVQSARFALPTFENLDRAASELRNAYGKGFDGAATYFLEGKIRQYDLDGGIEYLLEGARLINEIQSKGLPTTTAWSLNVAETWIKISGESTPSAASRFLRMAFSAIDSVELASSTPYETIRHRMLQCFATFLMAGARGIDRRSRGISFPFGLRATWMSMPEVLEHAADALLECLEEESLAGEYLYREVSAELCSFAASRAESDNATASFLDRAIRLRNGSRYQNSLSYDRATLDQAIDQLDLAHLRNNIDLRGVALKSLSLSHSRKETDAASLTVLALEIERRGAHIAPLLPVDSAIAIAIRNGDVSTLYGFAAAKAFASQDTAHAHLGGRGSVEVVDDAHGITGQTFVFKRMSLITSNRDKERTALLVGSIARTGLGKEFGVIEHIATIPEPNSEIRASDNPGAVVSVRRFSDGQTGRSSASS
jgi:hypothetical protein